MSHENQRRGDRPFRWMLASVGIGCVGLGAAGTVIPGLPTTIFLIIASWCFARSCPWLEKRLLRTRLFAPYMRYVDGTAPMPRRARAAASILLWVFLGSSLYLLGVARSAELWLLVLLAGAGMIGTVMIWRWRPQPARGGGFSR